MLPICRHGQRELPTHAQGPKQHGSCQCLKLDRDAFSAMSKRHPQIHPLYELRKTLGELRLNSLAVGDYGRNRTLLSPFSSKTGRNQPSTSKFVFGPSKWFRGLIKPTEGTALAYLDWGSQEIAIAAALFGDNLLWPLHLARFQITCACHQPYTVEFPATHPTWSLIERQAYLRLFSLHPVLL